MSEMEDLKRRLDSLEKENQKLREQAKSSGSGKSTVTTTTIGNFKGNPVIRFEGPFRPFSLGIRKAMAVLEKLEDIQFFVKNNKAAAKHSSDE